MTAFCKKICRQLFLSSSSLNKCTKFESTYRGPVFDYWPKLNFDSVFLKKNRIRSRLEGKDPVTIAVEGNIGCGKTTLLNHFSKNEYVEVHSEPVNKWRDMHGHNLLELMYKEPYRWSLAFQTYVQLTMADVHNLEQKKPVKMLERSIYSARYCFVENLFQSGKMSHAEYKVLCLWFDWLIKHTKTDVDLIVYLRTDPDVAYDRILKRSRPEEASIPYEYLESLHELHEQWLGKRQTFPIPAQILELDFNCSLDEVGEIYNRVKNEIMYVSKKI